MLAAAFKPPLVPRELLTERLRMRPMLPADAPHIQRILGDPRVGIGMATSIPYEEGSAAKWLAKLPGRLETGEGVAYAIEPAGTGEFIGALGINFVLHHARATLWYWLDVPHWNKGYCTEAVRAAVGYCFGELQMNRVEAYHHPANPASGRVMQKMGMREEGLMREHTRRGDNYSDSVLYSILRSEWEPGRGLRM